jgi:hypothetical protein
MPFLDSLLELYPRRFVANVAAWNYLLRSRGLFEPKTHEKEQAE